ncbi:MAG TPA: threonylcarbamoyl-AMP synthase [Fibrobacteres bacterium]|nr:threonylcarbamoyl-AMP synthase [Fibrobacterota bacterium]
MKVDSATSENIHRAAEALRNGELVAMPTETVYGLAGDALNPKALAKIFEVKQRPFFDPLIVHIADRNDVEKLCREIPKEAHTLMDRFWPGPLTLVLPKQNTVPDLATSGLDTVAIRMPSHPVARELLKEAGIPLAAPSANPFGRLSPTRAEHVAADFDSGIAIILDGGPCEVGVESTVVGWEEGKLRILRAGGIAMEAIEEALRRPVSVKTGTSILSPGNLPSHYAPRTPLVLLGAEKADVSPTAGLLWFGVKKPPEGFALTENLSATGDPREAATNLFAALHRLDEAGLSRIYVRLLPEKGLGRAINDRLRKAAAHTSG